MKYEAGLLARTAAMTYPDRIALTWNGENQTFAELNQTANALGSGLVSLGVEQGQRIGLLSFNRPEVIQGWFACEKFGLVRIAMHTHTPMADHVALLKHVGAKALMFDTRFTTEIEPVRGDLDSGMVYVAIGPDAPDWATPLAEVVAAGSPEDPFLQVDENDACFLQLTSGTTGMSKPWIKSYRSWLAVINHNAAHLDTYPDAGAIDTSDVNLHFHPLQWATGFQTLYPYFVRGARTVIAPDEPFDADAIVDLMISEGVTGTFAPGPLLTPILDIVESRGGIDHQMRRMVVFFGSPDLLDRTSKMFGPVWSHAFGSTEQGAATTRLLASHVEESRERIDSVGRPASPNLEIAIVDPDGQRVPAGDSGEIVVRSAMSLGSYWGMPEVTEAAFFEGDWFRSGDVGYIDTGGFLFYGDRAGDTIFDDGVAVYPHVLEASFLAQESVANVGVVPIVDNDKQLIVAAVLLKDGHDASDAARDALQAAVTASLAPGRVPDEIVFVDDIPTVLGGAKVQRGALRDQVQASR